MINPSEINLSALPSVALQDRSQLPQTPCIYFAIDSLGTVQYIGRTINLNQRWIQHHRHSQLSKMDSVRIVYLFADVDLLPKIEEALINWFQPLLNGSSVEFNAIEKIRAVCPHIDRPHYSGGRCKSCYQKARRDQGLYDRAASDAKYAQAKKGKERAENYDQTEAGRARKRKWKRNQKTAAPKNPA